MAAVIGHEGFLRHARFRWLKVAVGLSATALIGYLAADVEPRPNGGSWYGYTLGTIGALLIVWLALLGVRKRAMTRGKWSLKAWTSAHVYLGLSLIVVATLHSGFQFGWNVHTLAYSLMVLVIASGIWGMVAYATLPSALSSNRGELTQRQMIAGIEAIDRQLTDAAQPLSQERADRVRLALAEPALAGSIGQRLSGTWQRSATRAAIAAFNAEDTAAAADPALIRIEALLAKRLGMLDTIRRQLHLKALLEVWLYLHVPATFALLAALTAHIVSVFYYW